MWQIRGCMVDEASVPTAESGSRASWEGLSKQHWRSWLLPSQPPSRYWCWLPVYCPHVGHRSLWEGLGSMHPGEAQPAHWPRESHTSLLNKQLSQCSIYTGLSWHSYWHRRGCILKHQFPSVLLFDLTFTRDLQWARHGKSTFTGTALRWFHVAMSYEIRNYGQKKGCN